jgi:hypothetical protein
VRRGRLSAGRVGGAMETARGRNGVLPSVLASTRLLGLSPLTVVAGAPHIHNAIQGTRPGSFTEVAYHIQPNIDEHVG